MIAAAAFCPASPLLVPVAAAAPAEGAIAALRQAAAEAVEALTAACPDSVLVVGAATHTSLFSPVAAGSLRGYGLDVDDVHLGSPACGASEPLPPALTLGAWLLREHLGPWSGARAVGCGPDYEGSAAAAEVLGLAVSTRLGLLVMADGAERFPPLDGPGHTTDEIARSGEESDRQDEVLARALADGDGDTLADLAEPDALVCLSSRPAWRAAGALLAGPDIAARLLLRDASHGVGWLVASWTLP